jgi:hypothetical protein
LNVWSARTWTRSLSTSIYSKTIWSTTWASWHRECSNALWLSNDNPFIVVHLTRKMLQLCSNNIDWLKRISTCSMR